MRKAFSGIRAKLIVAVAAAAGAAITVTYVLYYIAERLYHNSTLLQFLLAAVRRTVGETSVTVVVWLTLFVLFFLLLTRRSVKRIDAVIAAVSRMGRGELDARVAVEGADEIGRLATAVNGMAARISASIEEERQSEKAKRELITSVSHDLRTPLTSIIGFLDLLTDRSGRNEQDLERYASVAHKKALRLQGLIDELFEYTRMGYGGVRLNPEPINLGELLGQVAEEFYPVFEASGMECRLALPEARVFVTADGELLHRLLENLFNNAVKYGADGRFIDVSLRCDRGMAVFAVVNYGQEIPREHLPFIFQRFYRAEQSRSRQTGGTGLGLAIAANIVELHNGKISAKSGPEGTCFTVALPCRGSEGGSR